MFSLESLFGKEVIVTLDPSWNCSWPGGGKTPEERLWCLEIQGKRGVLYPQTEKTVMAVVPHRVGSRLVKVFGDKAKVHWKSDGIDNEMRVEVPLDLVRSTFRYIKPRRRRAVRKQRDPI